MQPGKVVKWNQATLGNITTKIGSGATPRGGSRSYHTAGLTLIRSLNVYDLHFEDNGLAFIDEQQAEELANVKLETDDILLNITGASVARCCLVPSKVLPARVNQHVSIVRVNKAVADPKFVLYCITSPRYKQGLLNIAQGGATREALTRQKISDFEIPLPSLPTQQKIASMLSAYDDFIENNTRRIKILEEMAQTVYREWFVHFRFPGYEKVPMVDSDLGQIPQGWEVKRLGDVLTELETGSRPKGGVGEITSGIPSIGAEHIKGVGKFDFSRISYVPTDYFAKMKQGIIQDRDVLVYKDGGKPGYFIPHISMFGGGFPFETMAINSHVYRLRAINRISQEYLYIYLSSPSVLHWMHLYGTGAAIPSIARRDLVRLPFVVPSRETHQQYLGLASSAITQILFLAKKNQNLRKTRNLLLPRLISGQLDVEKLDIAV